MDGDQSLRRYLQDGVTYIATASRHYAHRPTQVRAAFYVAAELYVDDVPSSFPSEIPNIYLFNDLFIKGKEQGNVALNALADIIRRVLADLFRPVLSNLITTSTLDFVTSRRHPCSAAQQYSTCQRSLSGFSGAFAFMAFPREIPLAVYIQAVQEVMQFINELNDILSFYKEELAGENTNQISIMAARNKESKLETLKRVAESVIDLYKAVLKILEGSSEAYDAFRQSTIGFFDFHFALERYKLADLYL